MIRIDGEAGLDRVEYSGSQSAYTLVLGAEGLRVTDRREDGNGTDQLANVESLEFETGPYGPFHLDVFAGTANLAPVNFESFIELYIAYFNRAPDAVGLNFWGRLCQRDVS